MSRGNFGATSPGSRKEGLLLVGIGLDGVFIFVFVFVLVINLKLVIAKVLVVVEVLALVRSYSWLMAFWGNVGIRLNQGG